MISMSGGDGRVWAAWYQNMRIHTFANLGGSSRSLEVAMLSFESTSFVTSFLIMYAPQVRETITNKSSDEVAKQFNDYFEMHVLSVTNPHINPSYRDDAHGNNIFMLCIWFYCFLNHW